jgi:hypothetical protein
MIVNICKKAVSERIKFFILYKIDSVFLILISFMKSKFYYTLNW